MHVTMLLAIKILGVCNPNVWSIDAIEESAKYLFSKMNIEIK